MSSDMEKLIRKLSWVLFVTIVWHCGHAANAPKANHGLKKTIRSSRTGAPVWTSPRPVIGNGVLPAGSGIIGRQPPFAPQLPVTPLGAPYSPPFPPGPHAGAPFPNPWQQGPFPGSGPFGQPNLQALGNGPTGWPPPAQPEWAIAPPPPQQAPPSPGFGQQPGFWPQPSQWPFVDTNGLPTPATAGNFPWGQQGPPPPFPAQPPPVPRILAGGAGPNQAWPGGGVGGPPPAFYSQWLPSALGNTALPPSAPWNAAGTMVGGPNISPLGGWSPQPLAYNPPTTNSGTRSSNSIPQYIRSGYDASMAAALTPRNVNPFSRSGQNPSSLPKYVTPESQNPILEPPFTSAEANWQRHGSPPATAGNFPNVQAPLPTYNFQPSDVLEVPAYPGPTTNGMDYAPVAPYQPTQDAEMVPNVPPVRGRDPHPSLPYPPDRNEYEPQPRLGAEFYATTETPTTAQTDDPYALNPNIIFGGPASLTFPELTIGVPASGFSENTSSLSVSSIRIGDILSFPHGTGFGAVPPPQTSGMKKVTYYNSRTQDDARILSDHGSVDKLAVGRPRVPASASAIRVIPIDDEEKPGEGAITTEAPPTSTLPTYDPTNQIGRQPLIRPYKGVKHSQNVAKPTAGSLTDAILKQIQELKVVLYGRSNCSVCLETEALLKNYSIPVYYFELDSDTKGEQMLAIVQQMTHSLETPLTFICGRFVGGHQRLHDLHVNQQVTPLLRECLPSKRRSSVSILARHSENRH